MTAVRRATSFLLSAAMLLGNMVSPITAFAAEAIPEENEGYEVPAEEAGLEQIQTEAPDYLVMIPYYGETAFLVDESHVKKREDQGDTILTYKSGDDVKITVSASEDLPVTLDPSEEQNTPGSEPKGSGEAEQVPSEENEDMKEK